jgi:glycolate oxidase FAD binding subunit
MLDLGMPPCKLGTAVELTALNQVIDYPARDMTITVQAGITLSELQRILATENQRLPVDVPFPDRATLGGALAANASGPRRYGFGTLRDYVIGISVVNDRGEAVKAGGRVVKNVAGYDLCKLYTGSLGTLGVITQATLKVRPNVEASAPLAFAGAGGKVGEILDRLHGSRTRPCALELLSSAASRDIVPEANDWLVLVGFEDNRTATTWQVEQCRQELTGLGVELVRHWRDADTHPVWTALTDWPLGDTGGAPIVFKASVPPSSVAEFCRQALDGAPQLLAQAGNGIIHGRLSDPDAADAFLNRLRTEAAKNGGSVTLTRCPSALKSRLAVWGPPRGDWELMRAVKAKLDPAGMFNAGRFVGGM